MRNERKMRYTVGLYLQQTRESFNGRHTMAQKPFFMRNKLIGIPCSDLQSKKQDPVFSYGTENESQRKRHQSFICDIKFQLKLHPKPVPLQETLASTLIRSNASFKPQDSESSTSRVQQSPCNSRPHKFQLRTNVSVPKPKLMYSERNLLPTLRSANKSRAFSKLQGLNLARNS